MPPEVKVPKKQLATKATRKDCVLYWRDKETSLLQVWDAGTRREIRLYHKSIELFTNLHSCFWGKKLLITSKLICAARAQLSVLCRRQVWGLSGGTIEGINLGAIPAKCGTAMPKDIHPPHHTWRTCLGVHYSGKHFILKKFFLLLFVVLNVRYFFPWGQKVPNYMTVNGK